MKKGDWYKDGDEMWCSEVRRDETRLDDEESLFTPLPLPSLLLCKPCVQILYNRFDKIPQQLKQQRNIGVNQLTPPAPV
ncbi:hypothetical protein EGR_06978 [Echinococcus granulosus]|uniref:Uncharacterized protein n=1 Tax=Echinococcus granulosus TaxID=6210 RepID=W6U9U9_ECHGR|nr:hypothetical protein EGR_06978 [Echinococcus granulosus]EUB58148.1 hypothetical protein EGR_06978 [Echinococcus granulosus]